jgi:hypothetical protein
MMVPMDGVNAWVASLAAASLLVSALRVAGARPVRVEPIGAQLRVSPPLFGHLARDIWLAAWAGILLVALGLQAARGSWVGLVLVAALLAGLGAILVGLRDRGAVVLDRGADAIRVGSDLVMRASAVIGVQVGAADATAVALVVQDGMWARPDRLITWPLAGVHADTARVVGQAIAAYLEVPLVEPHSAFMGGRVEGGAEMA